MKPILILAGLGAASGGIYLAIALSAQSLHEEGTGGSSLLFLLALFGAAFILYLAALRAAVRAPQDRGLVSTILVGAVVFRATLLFSDPIEEVDLYRYLWDGMATIHGVNPFRYTPRQVLEAPPRVELQTGLDRLVAVRDQSPVNREILSRVHFGQLPTIYPLVSQAAFALNSALTPDPASIYWRMVLMKAWFVACDLGTVLLVLRLLRQVGKPVGWGLAYAWCPLVLKEIANSGHVDALAVLLSVGAVSLTIQALMERGGTQWLPILAALLLALACGAKLYPLVLTPWFVLSLAAGRGWRMAALSACVFAGIVAALMWPMVPMGNLAPLDSSQSQGSLSDLPPLPPLEGQDSSAPADGAETSLDPSQSMRAFLSEWEMNDFLFLIVIENVRLVANLPPDQVAWFSVVPESWRVTLIEPVRRAFDTTPLRAAFLMTRLLMSLIFLVLALALAWRAFLHPSADQILESAFLTLAWFWLLLPTQNPWYCTWFLPLVPFARNRIWVLLSGVALAYYLRFWLVFHFPNPGTLGTRYAGGQFFDYVVTWVEFAPWMTLLALSWFHARFRRHNLASDSREKVTPLTAAPVG